MNQDKFTCNKADCDDRAYTNWKGYVQAYCREHLNSKQQL